MTNEQVFEVIKQNLGEVKIDDKGWVAKGVHLIEIIVGSKINMQYNKETTPFLPEFESDKRILKLDGMEDYNSLVAKLQPIIKYMPGNRNIPGSTINTAPIATISGKSQEEYYKTPEIKPIENFDKDAEKLIKGVPTAPTQTENLLLTFMADMSKMMGTINDRLTNLETKKPMGRPKNIELHPVAIDITPKV
jgi:hypothetical protein